MINNLHGLLDVGADRVAPGPPVHTTTRRCRPNPVGWWIEWIDCGKWSVHVLFTDGSQAGKATQVRLQAGMIEPGKRGSWLLVADPSGAAALPPATDPCRQTSTARPPTLHATASAASTQRPVQSGRASSRYAPVAVDAGRSGGGSAPHDDRRLVSSPMGKAPRTDPRPRIKHRDACAGIESTESIEFGARLTSAQTSQRTHTAAQRGEEVQSKARQD